MARPSREGPLTIRYWQDTGGTLIEEFRAVKRGKDHGPRLLDGVIVLDGQNRRLENKDYDSNEIAGKDIIVVQTKADRVGMYLLGQALFSRELMRRFNPKTVRTVTVCGRRDAVLGPIAENFGIEMVCYD